MSDAAPAVSRGRRRLAPWVAAAVLVVLGGLVVVLATREPATDRRVSSPLIGQPAPPIAGATLAGDDFDLSSTRGDWVVVNFFATWCTPCRREHPELVSFSERHGIAGDARVISVVYNERASDAAAFFEDFGGDWPVVTDPEGRIALDYGVAAVPESFLVAPDGVVVAKIVGGVTEAGLDRILTEARGGGS